MLEVCPICQHRAVRARPRCARCGRASAFYGCLDMTDARWLSLVDSVTAGGRYHFSVNQLYIEWQRPRARRARGAWMRAQATALAAWVALAPPSAPPPLSALWGGEALAATAEGRAAQALMWALLAALALAALPWGALARPLPRSLLARLPPASPWALRALRRLRRALSAGAWAAGWGAVAAAALAALAAPASAGLPWGPPSVALAAPLLVGLAASVDAAWAARRAGRLRFMHHLQLWRRRYPLRGYL
ncbi:MAG: hypothetical protein FJ138_15630, partial [Deltaproteobacteria bacterium]|nr:hypothetical protein [Deltaproteobacteria bacterium]